MSLLGNLISQVAQSALQGQAKPQQDSGLGSILGGMLGQTQPQPQRPAVDLSNGFGLDDVIGMAGMAMNGKQNQSQGGMMGQVLGNVLSSQLGGSAGKNALMLALLPLALNFIQQNGGLSGALAKIQNMGFGNQAQSWLSTNQANQTLNPTDISQLFDDNQLHQVTQQTGCDKNEICQGMADLLPQVFDHLTPDGDTNTENQANDEISQILSQLSQFIK